VATRLERIGADGRSGFCRVTHGARAHRTRTQGGQKRRQAKKDKKGELKMPKTKKSTKVVATKSQRVSPTVTLKKAAKQDELPKQAAGILKVLEANGGKLTVVELTKRMEGKIETRQATAAIWGFYRARLVSKGFVAVAKGGTR